MFDFSLTEWIILVVVVAPPVLLTVGMTLIYTYIVYLLTKDKFLGLLHGLHFRHRKAH